MTLETTTQDVPASSDRKRPVNEAAYTRLTAVPSGATAATFIAPLREALSALRITVEFPATTTSLGWTTDRARAVLPVLGHPGALILYATALSAWLYRIARDKASAQWRVRPPERLVDVSDLVDEPSQNNEFRQEDAQEIHASLDQLTPEQREVLVLRFLEDMTYQEIARVTGCPIGTVRSRLYYAKSALRQAIEHRRST